jgi:hypothetical protein
MDPQDRAVADESSGESARIVLIGEALAKADEPERYRMLAAFFNQFAERCRNGAGSPGGGEQVVALGRKLQELEKRRADLEDQLRTVHADLAHRQKQLEAETARGRELEAVCSSQRGRLDAMEAQASKLDAELVNRNQDLHRIESEKDALLLKLQRAQIATGDTSRLEALEDDKRQLAAQVEALRVEMGKLRQDKNGEIERLTADLARVQGQASQSADAVLASLWQRLASAKPPLVTEGHLQPTVQAAERLFDAFIEMAGFVHKFDQDMRPNLDGFTQPDPELKRLWNVYKEQCDICQTIRQTVAPVQGKHVGALKMQLKVCRNWAFAALVSCDSTIEWIADELRSHLLGPFAAGSNPKCTLKDYVKMSGPEAFLEHMRKLRSQKLAEVYRRGA